MDEVLLIFAYPPNHAVDICNVKNISVTATGQEKFHFTVMLACCAKENKSHN